MPKPESKFNSHPEREWNTILKKKKKKIELPKNKQYWPCGIFHDLSFFPSLLKVIIYLFASAPGAKL